MWKELHEPGDDAITTRRKLEANTRDNRAEYEQAIAERDEARYNARVLASAWQTDSRPPANVVQAAIAYPVRPECDHSEIDARVCVKCCQQVEG